MAGQSDAKTHYKPHRAPCGRPQAPAGFAALAPHVGRPRAANPCTVFGVGFAVGVDFGQSCDTVDAIDKGNTERCEGGDSAQRM